MKKLVKTLEDCLDCPYLRSDVFDDFCYLSWYVQDGDDYTIPKTCPLDDCTD